MGVELLGWFACHMREADCCMCSLRRGHMQYVTKKSLAVAGFSATATKIAVEFAALFFSFRDERWIED